MKRNYRNLFMVGMMAIAACFTGCKEKDAPFFAASIAGNEQIAEEIRSTSASFTLKTENIETVAYLVEEGTVSESSKDAAVLYMQAEEEGRVVTVADGDNTINVYSLEGDTEYTIFFVYKKEGQLVITSKVFTTPAYDRIITVVESKKDGFKFHFNVPDTMYYMYAFTTTEWYNSSKMYGHSDIGFLMDGKMLKGPQTIEINAGDDWIEGDEADWYIHPGSAYTLLMAECDAEGNILYEVNPNFEEDPWGGGWGPLAPATRAGTAKAPRMGSYTEEPNYEEAEYATGVYARQFLLAELEMVESKINVELIGKTERRIKVRCTADDDVQYVVAPMLEALYNDFVSLVGEEAVASTLLEYYGTEVVSGTADFEIDENVLGIMEVDSTYIISVVGVYAEDASVLSYDSLHVTLTKSTLPAAEVTITGLEATDPNFAWFNIKSEKQNVFAAKHIANYTKEVQKMINDGYTYDLLLSYYGEYLSEEDVQAINSPDGLDISLYSMEDAETMLLIGAFNEEEGMTVYTGVSRSAEKPALPEAPAYNTLTESLKGDWTARIIQKHVEEIWMSDETMENWWTVDSVWVDTTYTTISLGESFDNSPETFGEDYDAYWDMFASHFNTALENGATEEQATGYAQDQVAKLFTEYKEKAAKYENKYKGQNYILGLGFCGDNYPLATPWDLFCAADYVAYDVEELFYAYGPKLFFQVQQDGSLELVCDATMTTLTPAATWGGAELVVVGNNPSNMEDPYNGNFPVEIIDNDNIVIKGVDYNGEMCYPAMGYWQWGWLNMMFSTSEDVVLTRGAAEEDNYEESADLTRAGAVKVAIDRPANNRIKRTFLPTEVAKAKTVKMSYVPVLDKIKEKYNASLNK